MVTDEAIAEALDSLIRESTPSQFTSINGVVLQLESKLGLNLSHKLDFIRSQIHLFFQSHQPQSQPPPPQPPSQQQPPKDPFTLQQATNFSTGPPNFAPHRTEDLNFRRDPTPAPPAEPTGGPVAVPEAPPQERFVSLWCLFQLISCLVLGKLGEMGEKTEILNSTWLVVVGRKKDWVLT